MYAHGNIQPVRRTEGEGRSGAQKTLEERISIGAVTGNDLTVIIISARWWEAKNSALKILAWSAGVQHELFSRENLQNIILEGGLKWRLSAANLLLSGKYDDLSDYELLLIQEKVPESSFAYQKARKLWDIGSKDFFAQFRRVHAK